MCIGPSRPFLIVSLPTRWFGLLVLWVYCFRGPDPCASAQHSIDGLSSASLATPKPQGIRNVPYRVRVKLSRRRNEDEEAAEKVRVQLVGLCMCVCAAEEACSFFLSSFLPHARAT